MKTLRIISYILWGSGILVSFLGFLSRFQHWPDLFKSRITGPVLIIAGTIIFIFTLLASKERKE